MSEFEPTRICIYFGDTGGGHRSAAEAIRAGVDLVAAESHEGVVQASIGTIVEESHPFSKQLVSSYNYLARHSTTSIKYFYNLMQFARLDAGYFYKLYRPFIHKLLLEQKPTVIVAAHPMILDTLARGRAEVYGDSVKLVEVITDPNEKLWNAWACKQADLLIAPNEVVRTKLLSWGIEPDKIRVLGMPVHPEFVAKPRVGRRKFLLSHGLSPNLPTVCVNSGWAGNAHMLDAMLALKNSRRELQAIFLCGHNEALYEKAVARTKELSIPCVVLPFCNDMSDLMNAVDVMVTKAGGLTTYQCIARRLPIVFDNTIEPMPQEEPTMRMLVDAGVAKRLNHADELPRILESLELPNRKGGPLPSEYQLDLTDSAIFEIAQTILDMAQPNAASKPSIVRMA